MFTVLVLGQMAVLSSLEIADLQIGEYPGLQTENLLGKPPGLQNQCFFAVFVRTLAKKKHCIFNIFSIRDLFKFNYVFQHGQLVRQSNHQIHVCIHFH